MSTSNVPVNTSVSFDATTSTDSDGTIASYQWTFGDGSNAAGAQATHSYSVAGVYNVDMRVTDNEGGYSTLRKKIYVGLEQSAVIGSSGGTINLANIATVSVPNGTFSSNTTVTVKADYVADRQEFENASSLFGVTASAPYVVVVTTSQNLAANKELEVIVTPPAKLREKTESVLGLLVRENYTNEDGDDVATFFDVMSDLVINGGAYSFKLEPRHFYNKEAQIISYTFESGVMSDFLEPIEPYGTCFGKGFKRPYGLNNGLPRQINGKFGENRTNPATQTPRPHKGLDVQAPRGTPLYSPGAIVQRRYVNCNRSNGKFYLDYVVPVPGSSDPAPEQQRSNAGCNVTFNPTTGAYTGYRSYGEILEIEPIGTNQVLKFTHLSPDSNFYNPGDYIPLGTIMGYVDSTSDIVDQSGAPMGPHIHMEMFTKSIFRDGTKTKTGMVDPLACMLNPNIKDKGTISVPWLPLNVTVEVGDDPNPLKPSRGFFNGGAGRIFKWTTPTGEKTTCGNHDFIVATAGEKPVSVVVTDYWGNQESDYMNFHITYMSGDKAPAVRLPFRSAMDVGAENVSGAIYLDPIADFDWSQVNAYTAIKFNASGSLAANGIIHTYRWYFDGNLVLETCLPVSEISFPDSSCRDVKLEVEDSGGKKAVNITEVCPMSGDK